MAEGKRTCCWDGSGCFNSNVDGDDDDGEEGEAYDGDDSEGEEGGGRRRRHGKL